MSLKMKATGLVAGTVLVMAGADTWADAEPLADLLRDALNHRHDQQ